MPTYTVANMSGSVGKTTSVVTSAVLLAATGLRVRVIDLDPQANASTWLGYPNITGATIADVLRLDATINDIERPARVIQGYSEEGEPVYDGARRRADRQPHGRARRPFHPRQAHGRTARRHRRSDAAARRSGSGHTG